VVTAMQEPGSSWIGRPWAEVEPLIRADGLTYEAVVTRPPNRPVGVGDLRVVAVRPRPEGLSVVLAYRDYERAPTSDQG
jgi:hypothetical protein